MKNEKFIIRKKDNNNAEYLNINEMEAVTTIVEYDIRIFYVHICTICIYAVCKMLINLLIGLFDETK